MIRELENLPVLVLAEKGLILFTVVPVVVGDLSSFPCSATSAGGWEGRGGATARAADPDWPMAGSFHTM